MCSGLFLLFFFFQFHTKLDQQDNFYQNIVYFSTSIVHKYMLGAACFSLAGLERHEMLL